MFDTFELQTTPVAEWASLVERAHYASPSAGEAVAIARSLVEEARDGTYGPLVTNTEVRADALRAHGIDPDHTTPVACPRCAKRGVERMVGHHLDWEVCHVPFLKREGGYGSTSPRDLLHIGCRSCNRADPDWGIA